MAFVTPNVAFGKHFGASVNLLGLRRGEGGGEGTPLSSVDLNKLQQ